MNRGRKRFSQRGTAEFPGIGVMLSLLLGLRHQNMYWRAASVPTLASARTRRHTGRQQGLNILAREAYKIAVPNSADIPSRLVMGLHDASRGACGELCLCGRDSLCAQKHRFRNVLYSDRRRGSHRLCSERIWRSAVSAIEARKPDFRPRGKIPSAAKAVASAVLTARLKACPFKIEVGLTARFACPVKTYLSPCATARIPFAHRTTVCPGISHAGR